MQDGNPWFVVVDVCRVLGLGNSSMAISKLDDDEKSGVIIADPHGREQETRCVSEPGLYSLIIRSRKPQAKEFKRWITHDVIPSIRKHGAYATEATIDKIIDNPDFGIHLLQQLKAERAQNPILPSSILSLQNPL